MCKVEMLARAMQDNYDLYKNDPEMLEFMRGLFSQGLYVQTPIHTGFISEEAEKLRKDPKYTPTKEHFFGRAQSTHVIIDQLKRGKSKERIKKVIRSRSRVHYTTKKENETLASINKKNPGISWRKLYELAGIKLIPYIHKSNKHVYYVGDVMYNTIQEVADHYGITQATAWNRFTSKAKRSKFEDWKRYERKS